MSRLNVYLWSIRSRFFPKNCFDPLTPKLQIVYWISFITYTVYIEFKALSGKVSMYNWYTVTTCVSIAWLLLVVFSPFSVFHYFSCTTRISMKGWLIHKKYIKLLGVTPPTPFVTSVEADFSSIEHRTHVRASTCKS